MEITDEREKLMRQRQREREKKQDYVQKRGKRVLTGKIDFSISSVRPRMCNAHELDVCRSSVLLVLRHFGCFGLLVISTHSMLKI